MVEDRTILILGSSPAALQAARDLADGGTRVNLVEGGPFLGIENPGPEPSYLRDSRLLEIIKHPLIQAWTNTEVEGIGQAKNGCWDVDLVHQPRYIDLGLCNACGECVEVCPVTIPGTELKAIHFGGQPDCAVITKEGCSPCSAACPAGIHVQGYVALTGAGRYQEAYDLIHEALPFPSVCGRVCNHYCEESCSRSTYDAPVNIMALKRFVADRVYKEQDRESVRSELFDGQKETTFRPKRVAVIGAGPAGLTAARDLVREGYPVTVFDANSVPGGMMRVGIPPHRLDYDQLAWEIEQIALEGVDLRLNTWVDDIPALLGDGFAAVLIATGAHQAVKVDIPNADHPDNWLSLDFLKKVCLGEDIDLTGRQVIVLGGGDVAMDAARSAVRLGEPTVKVVCRGMRASFNEIKEAEEEGIEIIPGQVFKKVVLDKRRIIGLECLEAEVGEIVNGKRQFKELPGTEHVVPGDLVIWALGQRPDFSFLPPGELIRKNSDRGIQADPQMMTSLEGVFTAGDVRRGTTFFVVDAVGEGHRAARAIMDYLEGALPRPAGAARETSLLAEDEIKARIEGRKGAARQRTQVPCLPAADRSNNFAEVEKTFSERQALQEAGRCLVCGPCSECLACVEVCQAGAIFHHQTPERESLEYQGVIAADPPLDWFARGVVSLEGDSPLAGSAAAYPFFKFVDPPAAEPGLKVEEKRVRERTGVLLCQCGGKISDLIDTAALREEALSWSEVDLAEELPYSCTAAGAEAVQSFIKENDLQRLVLAACSCCEKDQVCYSCTYQRVRCKSNLGIYAPLNGSAAIHFVNIREGCAYLHPRSKAKATEAAKTLVRTALARDSHVPASTLGSGSHPLRVLVVGEGASAEACLQGLDGLGIPGHRLEAVSGKVVRSGGLYRAMLDGEEIWGDCLVLAPASGAELDFITSSVELANHKRLLSGGPGDWTARDLGIVICPPELDPETTGRGAAVQAAAWSARVRTNRQPAASVDPLRCRNCGTCLEVCGLGIPALVVDRFGNHAEIDPCLCLDCGVCAAHCPSGAIQPGSFSDQVLQNMLVEALR
ncbi:MAG: FAD-dependent oxidoreductase [Anaerolineales bacterium]